jgi:hypothetical protein
MPKGNKTGKGGFRDNPQNINRNGAPPRGESWKEIIDRVGNMTPKEAADHAVAIAGKLKSMGNGITLKEAVVIRGYAALLFEPSPGIMTIYMDRSDGKVTDKLALNTGGEIVHKVVFVDDTSDKGNEDSPASPTPDTGGGE